MGLTYRDRLSRRAFLKAGGAAALAGGAAAIFGCGGGDQKKAASGGEAPRPRPGGEVVMGPAAGFWGSTPTST